MKQTDSTVRLCVGEWPTVKLCMCVCVCVCVQVKPTHVPVNSKLPSHSALRAQPPISAVPNKRMEKCHIHVSSYQYVLK